MYTNQIDTFEDGSENFNYNNNTSCFWLIEADPGKEIALDFNYFDTSGVKHLILDEADRMLDMGFYDDIMDIAKKIPMYGETIKDNKFNYKIISHSRKQILRLEITKI
mgnify:CR=1 FL=1